MHIIGSGLCGTPVAKLTRSGNPDILSLSSVKYNDYSYLYTLNLTQAAAGCYDILADSNTCPWSLNQAFTVMMPLPTPVDWRINDLGQAGTKTNIDDLSGIDIGDADQDNGQEIYVANQDQTLYLFRRIFQTWNCSALTGQTGARFGKVLLADGNDDRMWEAYGASASDTHPVQFEYSASTWQKTDIGAGYANATKISAITKGDLDHDGIVEIYAAETDGNTNSALSRFMYAGTSWTTADIPGCSVKPIRALTTGDGDNDTHLELYAANEDGSVYQYQLDATAWQVSVVGTGTDIMYGVAVGDGDNDGENEVYASNKKGDLYQYRRSGSVWVTQKIGQSAGNSLYAVAVSDGDNDGANEVYAACGNGHVYEFTCESGNWTTRDLGNANTPLYALAVGDADNDHHFEVYALGQNNHLYQFQPFAQGAPTPTPALQPPQSFFKIYRNQINPNHGEQAAIRWTQTQTGPVTVVVYNLLGDKIVTLADHKDFPAGQYNELTWDGRNCGGAAVGSGIYIVLLQTDGRQERGKIAVLK